MVINKIGIFGGTFDPIHYGHINIANDCINKLNLDYLFFVPNCIAYHKKTNVTSSNKRLEMCKICCRLNPKFKTSDIDIKRGSNTYTYDTVKEFNKLYPNNELWLLIGSDCLENLHTWYKFQEIQKFTNFIIAQRYNFDIKNLNKQTSLLLNKGLTSYKENNPYITTGKYVFLNSNIYDITSSTIKNMIKSKKDISNIVPNIIIDYIYANNLYQL